MGGLLTNQRTVQNSVNRLRTLERLEKTNFEGYKKKEALELRRELEKLDKTLGGVKFMRRLPQAIIVTSVADEKIAISEAKLLKIPVIGLVDTDSDPTLVSVPIVGNDDSNKSVALITTLLADAIIESQEGKARLLAAYKADDAVVVEGIVEIERKPRFNKKPAFNNDRARAPRAPRVEREVEESTKSENKGE